MYGSQWGSLAAVCSCNNQQWYTLCTCVTGTRHFIHSLIGNKRGTQSEMVKLVKCKELQNTHTRTHMHTYFYPHWVFVGLLAYVNSCGVCPSIQESFWCLVQICEQYLPGYYSPGLVSAIYFLIRKVLEYQVTWCKDAVRWSELLYTHYYSDRFDIQLCLHSNPPQHAFQIDARILKSLLTKHLPAVKTWMDVSQHDKLHMRLIPTWPAQWGVRPFINVNVCSSPLWHTKPFHFCVVQTPTQPWWLTKGSGPHALLHRVVYEHLLKVCEQGLVSSWCGHQSTSCVSLTFSDPFPGRRYWECGTCSFLREWKFSIRSP